MTLFLHTTADGLQMGLCFAVLALGVYLSYAILDFPDLTVDGSFPLGGVVGSVLLLRAGFHPAAVLPFAFLAGATAGAVTGLLHVRGRISPLLSGIITMTGLLSVNLALTALLSDTGTPTTIFSYRGAGIAGIFHLPPLSLVPAAYRDAAVFGLLLLSVLLCKGLLDAFLATRLGFLLRAAGENEQVVRALGRDPGHMKILGLSLANGLSALSGALYAQLSMQYDNNVGSGKVVLGLASVIIGCALLGRMGRLRGTTAVIFGAAVYSLCLNYLVLIDKNGIYLKLLNALLFTLILLTGDRLRARRAARAVPGKKQSEGGVQDAGTFPH